MDQIKVEKFIAACRKQAGLTQAQLAERRISIGGIHFRR